MAKFIPIILPQPGEDLRTWARQLTSQLQSLTAQLSSVLANIEVTGGGGTPTPGGTTTPVKTPDGTTVLDVQGYYIDGLGRVIVDATGFHVYDLVGFQVINGPNVYINTEHLVENAVKTAQLANDAVTYEKFFPDLVPIKVVDTLPNPVGYTGPGVVWLSTDLKLYRHAGTAWTSAVPAVDITGQLTNAQLESIAAAKLTGQIVETQIADDSISTPKLAAGSVSTAKLAAGAVVADTIAANAVTAVKLAANAVEADKIAANAVTTSKLDANAVTTEKLDALAVTAGKLAAGSVVAGKLAANAIVANDGVIANAAIANAQIIDLAADKITAGSIAAERMEANIVTALNGKFATLSALASSLGVVQILPGGALFTQGATAYASGTGFWTGQDAGAYKWRVGNPAGARIQWTGSALEVYNSSNQLTIASGDVNWAGITGVGKPENGATVGADSSNLKSGPGVNMVFNGDYTDGLAGTTVGWRSAGNQHTLSRNLSNYIVQGEGTAYIVQPGWNGTAVFDANIWNGQEWQYFAVTPGQRYEVYAYLNTHRCVGRVIVIFVDAAGNWAGEITGSEVNYEGGINTISDMRRSHGFAVAPWNAAKAMVIVRGYGVNSYDPYVFFSRVYFGEAGAGQTEPSLWTPGRGISQITTSNVSTYIANAALGNAQIGGNLWSTNWNYAGGTGWLLDRSGNFYGNNIYARGDIEASSLKANTAMVNRANIVDAAVDTFQIAGNAVTVPVGANGTTSATTASVSFRGAPVIITASGTGCNLNTNPSRATLSIYRDSTLLTTYDIGLAYSGTPDGGPDVYAAGSITYIDYPGTAPATYTVQLGGATYNASCAISVIGARR